MSMPRNPLAALVQFPLGLLLGGAGILMIGWVVLAHLKLEAGFDAAMWVAANSPIALTASPEELANSAIQESSLIGIGVIGFFVWLVAWGLLRAARINMRPAKVSAEEALSTYTPAPPPASSQHAGSTVFAHKLLSDTPTHVPTHVPRPARASPVAIDPRAEPTLSSRREGDLAGLARLIGTDGKFTPQQREALAKLTLEQHAALAKFSKWAPSRKNAIIALIAIFFAFQLLPSIFSFLLHR